MSSFNKTSAQDLQKTLVEKRKALQSFRFNLSGSKTRNVKEGRGIKKEIAQILTALNARNA
ncbi:MAG: 50S ribosomal protein L29 [Patescibacteria group bacterium]